MVAKVLVIDAGKIDISCIINTLSNIGCALEFPESIDKSLEIISTQSIDLVLITLPEFKTDLLTEFLSVFRQSSYGIPVIGILQNLGTNAHWISDLGIDDIIFSDIHAEKLMRKINSLSCNIGHLNSHWIRCLNVDCKRKSKIVTLFHKNLDFISKSVRERSEIVSVTQWPTSMDEHTDLFIINVNHAKAFQCCMHLNWRKNRSNIPVVLSYDTSSANKIVQANNLGIKYADTINVDENKDIIACRLNSLIKYKMLQTELRESINQNWLMSAVDYITEVYNRSFFENYLRRQQDNKRNCAILMIDVDKFKSINDTFGHTFADAMLKYIAAIIKKYVRSSDMIARYGGDEFIIVMNDISADKAIATSERIKQQVEEALFCKVPCTVSIGVCCVGARENLPIKEAIAVADKFMYIAKQNGGNSVKVCA